MEAKNQAVTILDHIDGIAVEGEVFDAPANEYWLLRCLYDGMEFLYRNAKKCDETYLQSIPKGIRVFAMGNLPEFGAVNMPLLTCSFLWYAMSAYQYGLIVGRIAYHRDNTRPLPNEYLKAAMPEILVYRDKIAAHVAWAKNNKRDSRAERLASVIQIPTFQDDSFHVGAFTVGYGSADDWSTSEAIKCWSICKMHEKLKDRYWPDA